LPHFHLGCGWFREENTSIIELRKTILNSRVVIMEGN
jgi:hypothetical protein